EIPLLLHSLREFSSLIFPSLEAAGARRILEIGSEAGLFTRELCEWAAGRDGSVAAIEPLPGAEHEALQREHGLQLIVGKSPGALEGLPPFDAYFLDGDHNYWCVSRELPQIFAGDAMPLAVLHDVGWPCGRRDLYYNPRDIPAEHRHPFTYDGGVEPGNPGIVRDGGFRGEDSFACARQEGGQANGVLTAVEDFLADRPDLTFLRVPVVFGLGLVFPSDAAWADEIHRIVGPFHENPILARLEANRIRLFLTHIDPYRSREGSAHAVSEVISGQQREIDALAAEALTLRLAAERQG
ncbi:MAG: class I SAM-dependent methyltransferase, partial [Solirubrobacteraceae bacterium]